MPYLEERFEAAVSTLVGDGSVKDRLVTAYAVTPIGREPYVRAATRKMSKLQAGNHGRTILSLDVDLVCHGKRAKPLRGTSLTDPIDTTSLALYVCVDRNYKRPK